MSFTARESDFAELWGSTERKYVIPRYQREYSWKEDNLVTFWEDIHLEEELFFGSVVLKKPEHRNSRIEIIDGQQRMLTMTILYAAIRDVLKKLGAEEEAGRLHSTRIYQFRGLRDGHFIIQPTVGLKDYFERSVQSSSPDFRNPKTNEHKRVRKNYNWLTKEIMNILVHETTDENLGVIEELVNKIGKMQIIMIKVDDSYDAYRIFETVNATGVDLSVADLLKNMVFRHIPEDEDSGDDPAQKKWIGMKENLAEINLDVARFVRYHWISSRETVTMRHLYKSVKKATSARGWKELLDNLLDDSRMLNQLMLGTIPNPNTLRVLDDINKKLRSIAAMGFSQCYVLLLSLFRNRERLSYTWDEFNKLVTEIENFNFIYHTICTRPANKVENFYSKKAISIQAVGTDSDGQTRLRSNVNAIYNELGTLRPSRVEFIEDFRSSTQYGTSTKKKSLIRYILGRIEENNYPGQVAERPIDDSISIEHILPQKPEQYWGMSEQEVKPFVHQIGNLVLVGQGFNSSARNFDLARKILELNKTAIKTTSDLLDQIESQEQLQWTRTNIEERTNLLAELAFDELWA